MARSRDELERRELGEEADSLVRIAAAPLIWAAHFVLCYGATSLVCVKFAPDGPETTLRIALGVLTVAAVAAIAWLGWRSWRQWDYPEDHDYVHDEATEEDRHEFLGHAAFLLAVISLIGVIYTALPVLMLPGCI